MNTLYSNIIGEGTPLIILHGFLGMSDNWKTLGKQFADSGFEVHLVDQRNHGRSFWSDQFNYTLMVEDLKNYMEVHQLDSSMILGHSMGGKTAMNFACTYPGKCARLLVADIGPKAYPPHHQHILDSLNQLDLEKIPSRTEADEALSVSIPEWGIRQFLLKNLFWKEKEQLGFRMNLKVLSEKMQEIGEALKPSLTYTGKTLFINGSKSDYITEEDWPEIQKHFPNAVKATLAGAGHWLHAEKPEEFFRTCMLFMNS